MSKPFRSDKRKKELQRLKKQEEKRLRRFGLKQESDGTSEADGVVNENEITGTGSVESDDGNTVETTAENEQSETEQKTD